MKKINLLISVMLAVVIMLTVLSIGNVSTVVAAGDYGLSEVKSSGVVTKSASEVAGTIIQTIIGIAGIILTLVLIYGGVLYMTSGGNEEKVATAKKAITYGIVGIVIIALAFAITRFVLDALMSGSTGSTTPTSTTPSSTTTDPFNEGIEDLDTSDPYQDQEGIN